MILALLLVPVVAAVAAFLPRAAPLRRGLLVLAAALHAGLSLATWATPASPEWHGMLALDAAGRLVLTVTSVLFFFVALYVVGYLGREVKDERRGFEGGVLFTKSPEAGFVAGPSRFLGPM